MFVTIHGESARNGIGGTVKRPLARAGLHTAGDNHILASHQAFIWAPMNILGVFMLQVQTLLSILLVLITISVLKTTTAQLKPHQEHDHTIHLFLLTKANSDEKTVM